MGWRAQACPRMPTGALPLPQCVGSSAAAALAPSDLELSAAGALGGTECEEEGRQRPRVTVGVVARTAGRCCLRG